MSDDRLRRHLASLAREVAGRSPGEERRLADALARRSWPRDADRTVPGARAWVRHWGPLRAPAERLAPLCLCAEGRCPVCN